MSEGKWAELLRVAGLRQAQSQSAESRASPTRARARPEKDPPKSAASAKATYRPSQDLLGPVARPKAQVYTCDVRRLIPRSAKRYSLTKLSEECDLGLGNAAPRCDPTRARTCYVVKDLISDQARIIDETAEYSASEIVRFSSIQTQIESIAAKYGCGEDRVLQLFKQCSCDAGKVERQLNSKDQRLWSDQEDYVLRALLRSKTLADILERADFLGVSAAVLHPDGPSNNK